MYTLLKHELKRRRLAALLTLLAIAALYAYTFRLLGRLTEPVAALGLPALALIFPLILWALWLHWQSLREEWQEGTTHFLFSFPLRGWQVLLAKGGAVAIYFLIFTLFSAVLGGAALVKGFTAAGSPLSREDLRQLIFSDGSKLYVQYLLVAFSLIAYSQLAFILGQISSRWQGILSAVSFVAIFYLVGKLLALLEPVINLLPEVSFSFGTGSFNPWYMVAAFCFSLLAAGLAGWLLDHKVDF